MLDPHRLLATWAAARPLPPSERALTMLAAVEPEGDPAALAALSIAERDRRLLHCLAVQFSDQLHGVADCHACGAPIEITCAANELAALPGQASGHLDIDDLQVAYRAPTSQDIASVVAAPARGRRLIERCIACVRAGQPVEPATLPDAAIDVVAAAMLELDPLLELEFAVTCPACGASQQLDFDPAGFLWTQLEAEARRLLGQVHLLASAYGWSEAEILALPVARRAAYLELVEP